MVAHRSDVLIIGGGSAGSVSILSKVELGEGSSMWAQGGISAVLDDNDSFESHIKDTHVAGADLCRDKAVRHIIESAPAAIQWLIDSGVKCTPYHLTREGGHSHRRVIHAEDATGREVTTTLEKLVKAHPQIKIFEHHIAVDLITSNKLDEDRKKNHCYGAYALDIKNNEVKTFAGRVTVLATGGASKAYLYTSNPDTSTGDGIAMAWRAGARVANMEFVQFHPTCLYHPHAKSSLISEALRGEGATLHLPDGTRFMKDHHELMELAN